VAEVHQIDPPGLEVGREGPVGDRREQVALVEVERVAAEAAVLDPAAVAVLGAVQVHQHVGHDHLALVVEGLAQVLLPVGVLGVGEAGHRHDLDGGCAHGRPPARGEM